MTERQVNSIAIELTIGDGDRTSIIRMQPANTVDRVKVLRVTRALLVEIGLTGKFWSRATAVRMVTRLAKECPASNISWTDVPGGAHLPLQQTAPPAEEPAVVYGAAV